MRTTTLKALPLLAALAAAAPTAASEIRVGITADIQTLDPQNYRDRTTQMVIGNLCDGFFLRTGRDPELAVIKEWVESDGGKTIDVTIRDGVKFHDGSVLTAEDVKFTFDRMTKDGAIDGKTSPRKSFVGPLTSVEVTGPLRVRLTLSAPYPILAGSLTTEPVLSKRFVERVGAAGMATQVNCTGPFKLAAWNRGDNIVMERFADYYGGPPTIPPAGPARFDRLTFKVIPETASRVAALLAGEIDIATEVPVFMRRQIDGSRRAKVVAVDGTRTFFVALNNTKAPFNDIRVRHAANHAVDRKLIVDKVLAGTGTLVNGVLSQDSFGSHPNLPAYAYDLRRARALLAEAGYPNGLDITLDALGANKDWAESIAQMLTEAGIRTKVQIWEGAVISPLWVNHDKKERDAYLTSWGNGGLDPNGIFNPTLATRDRGNHSGFSNPKVDELLGKAQFETDKAKRTAMYNEAEEIVNRQAPWIFLWVPQDIYGIAHTVRDWQPHPSQMMYMHRATVAR
jgi:peptide/nickel transport system substrate-binding protein